MVEFVCEPLARRAVPPEVTARLEAEDIVVRQQVIVLLWFLKTSSERTETRRIRRGTCNAVYFESGKRRRDGYTALFLSQLKQEIGRNRHAYHFSRDHSLPKYGTQFIPGNEGKEKQPNNRTGQVLELFGVKITINRCTSRNCQRPANQVSPALLG
jgi:hypothetical protein